jgi:hypothetical protein
LPRVLPNIRTDFLWDESAQRYRSASTGRFISNRSIKQAVNSIIARSQRELRSLASLAANGELNLTDFQERMAGELKNLHLTAAAAGKGGWDQMRPADFGRVGAELRFQYERLELFVRHIEAGDLSPKQITARTEMYIGAANGTFEATRRSGAEDAGFSEERNILGDSEHCGLCLQETAKEWQPIGSLIPIGERTCLSRCKCSLEFR